MKRKPTLLVTGGAGYIGSHVVAQLGARGERIVVLDNLSTGRSEAVLHGRLVVGDIGNQRLLRALFREYHIEAVLHFAGRIVVPESVEKPLEYYDCNTSKACTLMAECNRAGVKQFIFSSTAAVYDDLAGAQAKESSPTKPANPYGRSKLMTEWILGDLSAVSPMRHVILRYFNVAGCDDLGRIGQDSPEATHLIKVACQHAVGLRPDLEIFGTDYPTPDGTCVRDYIHVEDLATAHLNALDYLRAGNASLTANCGYGHGFSVREVIATLRRVHGRALKVRESGRRAGDTASLVANSDLIRERLGWRPSHDNLSLILASALDWERQRLARSAIMPAVPTLVVSGGRSQAARPGHHQ
ncbi:UDP-glucose 4-epimerase GalE [Wenzhouxiangella sp. EGI_FJ10305]|uniref:UDP-glucose 4-epimerase GalE n=1 Tax=Wenzhouxiangella sp. EGI_FJ10305 TaxID=3243768 RepID=UPI0035DE96DA